MVWETERGKRVWWWLWEEEQGKCLHGLEWWEWNGNWSSHGKRNVISKRRGKDKTLKKRKLDHNRSENHSWGAKCRIPQCFIPELIPVNRRCLVSHDAQMGLVSSISFPPWNVYSVEGEKAAELPAETRKENQESSGDGACSPGISVNTRTRSYRNPFLWIFISGVLFQHGVGAAGVDHPNSVLFAAVLVFQGHFQSHFLMEDLWCFPWIQPQVDCRWKSLIAHTEDWRQHQKNQWKPIKKKRDLSLPYILCCLFCHTENERNSWGLKLVGKRD